MSIDGRFTKGEPLRVTSVNTIRLPSQRAKHQLTVDFQGNTTVQKLESRWHNLASVRVLIVDEASGNRESPLPLKAFFRFALPAQPVDATPSNALIRQSFSGRSDRFGCARSNPSQGSVPADLTLASDLAFVFKGKSGPT